ncbi:MAG: hypothetical protein GEV10_05380 [Streptosporangiales bacterium]|nr:hypothetical protein [Streptosporangiales bacterium]
MTDPTPTPPTPGTDAPATALPPEARPAARSPWNVFVLLLPITVIASLVAGAIGHGNGETAGLAKASAELAARTRDGARPPLPSPTTLAPEPFISSMPRPFRTGLDRDATPIRIVGPTFSAPKGAKVLSPNVPFSFRVAGKAWRTTTPAPEQDIAFSQAFSRPTGSETAATSPLRVDFAWRVCGKCLAADAPTFDKRFRERWDLPSYRLRQLATGTYYAEVEGDEYYHLVVRRNFDSPDGRVYVVQYATRAPLDDKAEAQELANEIRSQLS